MLRRSCGLEIPVGEGEEEEGQDNEGVLAIRAGGAGVRGQLLQAVIVLEAIRGDSADVEVYDEQNHAGEQKSDDGCGFSLPSW